MKPDDRFSPDAAGDFGSSLRGLVLRRPEPGRPVPWLPVLRRTLLRRGPLLRIGLGVLDLAFVAWWGSRYAAGPVAWLACLLLGGMGVGLLLKPLRSVRRLRKTLRHGVICDATVHERQYLPPGKTDVSRAARRNGFAWGMRVVDHPRGFYEDEFECDDPWAGDLKPGSIVRVLADPTRKKSLIDLGPPDPREGERNGRDGTVEKNRG